MISTQAIPLSVKRRGASCKITTLSVAELSNSTQLSRELSNWIAEAAELSNSIYRDLYMCVIREISNSIWELCNWILENSVIELESSVIELESSAFQLERSPIHLKII